MIVSDCRIEFEMHAALSEWVILKNGANGFYWYTTKNYFPFENGKEPIKTLKAAINDIESYEKEALKELGLWDYKTGKPTQTVQ